LEGRDEGRAEGRAEGEARVLELMAKGYSVEQIKEILNG
jgi:predicted transposase YdaD